MEYKSKTWELPTTFIGSISRDSIDEHIKLYNGYVKHFNIINNILISTRPEPGDENLPYAKSEVSRRLAFEWNGIKNHEYYFDQLVGGPAAIDTVSDLYTAISNQFGSYDHWLETFTLLAKTRGIGWAILWRDRETGNLINNWVDEQHIGQLNSCDIIYAIDMWEHSFVFDYKPSGKASYITDYIANTNWTAVQKRYQK